MPFFHYLYELIEGIFHLDNKTWLTIKTLFTHPGKITKDFVEDKRNRYSPPVRMFIWCTAFYMFSFWLVMDTSSHYLESSFETSKSLSQRFDEMPDSSTTPIRIITNGLWPSLPSTPVNKLRALKRIPNNEIKKMASGTKLSSGFFLCN
ncbi:MAG: DUF3667 domain-containing protein [Saprospiraceae bacterium]|nr:DUF3667 domain-containing protein [Saprospiraceae bacterium]